MTMKENNKPITKIAFDLDRESGMKKVTGEAVFYRDRIEVSRANDKRVIETEGITEYRVTMGVGAVLLEAVKGEDYILICRGTMIYTDTFSLCSKRLNKLLSSGEARAEWLEYENRICPKCHRTISAGMRACPHCAPKGQYIRRLWQMSKSIRPLIFASVFIFFAVTGLNLFVPYINRILVDDYIQAETLPVISQYVLVILSMLGVQVISRAMTILRSYINTLSANKIIIMLRSLTFTKVQKLSLSKVSKRTSGELMNRINDDTRQIQNFLSADIGTVIENFLIIIGISAVLFWYDWRLALMILFPVPLVVASHLLRSKFLRVRFGRQWFLGAKVNTVVHDIFSGIRVVKSFGMEKSENERYDAAASAERKVCADNETYFALIFPITSFLMGVGEFFLLYFVGNKILDGTMTLGEMQQFSAYVSMIYGPLRWLSFFPRRLSATMTSVAKVFDVIDEESDVSDRTTAVDKVIDGTIDIENVSFGYESGSNVLNGVSLHIEPGEMIGVVGRSGVGKSTLINLIMRMYDPDDGAIKIGGTDIRDIRQHSLRSQMGVVLQETMLFSGTLYDNIAYSKPGADAEEVITAAKLAGVHKFAVRLSDGYNTVIGEKGYTLSGGERQRVAIARALLHDPRVLILDEATSALDTETEKDIQDALQKLISGRTTIAIAHRLSTLRNATRLVVLDKGRVAEVGTHDELMDKEGLYYELVMAQRQMSKMN